jgi:hypothetical protein
VAVRTEKAPPLDASLSDAAWKSAVGAGDLEVVTTQKPSSRPSRFLLLYDDANLYVGMSLEQPGVPVTASQGAHGVGFGLDDFAGIVHRPERQRRAGLLLHGDAAGDAVSGGIRVGALRAAVDCGRDADGERLERDDGHPALGAAHAEYGRSELALQFHSPLRRGQRERELGVRPF